MNSTLLKIAGVLSVILIFGAYFAGLFNPIFEFIWMIGIDTLILMLLTITILVAITIRFDGMIRVAGVVGLMVIAFVFLFVPNFIMTYGFTTLFSLNFFLLIAIVLIVDALLPPFPSSELLLIIPLKKYFGIPLWIGEIIALTIALISFFVITTFYPFIWELLWQNITIDPIHIAGFIVYSVVAFIILDRLIK